MGVAGGGGQAALPGPAAVGGGGVAGGATGEGGGGEAQTRPERAEQAGAPLGEEWRQQDDF